MNRLCLFYLLCCCVIFYINGEEGSDDDLIQGKKKLSEYVDMMLEHYKQEDPVGIPGAPIPDPLPIPNMTHSLSGADMEMMNVSLYGLRKFRINEVRVNIAQMLLNTSLTIEQLTVRGNYTLASFFSNAKGPFVVNLTEVFVTAEATLMVKRNGKLEAQDMDMDVTFKNMKMQFDGLGFMASVFQSVMNSAGNLVFDSVKPFVLSEVNTNMREKINQQIEQLNQTFPNSISPFDELIAEVRHKIRKAKYDPYKVKDYNTSVGIFEINMKNTWLHGVSSIYRHGDILFEIRNKTVYAIVDVGTQTLKGISDWEIALVSGILSRAGTVTFEVEYIRVEISLSQSMDTRKHPNLEDIQLDLGNIQLRFDGAGTMDYLLEFAVNFLPNILRYQIMDAIETPIKQRIQEMLNKVNTESLIKENVKKLDENPSFNFL